MSEMSLTCPRGFSNYCTAHTRRRVTHMVSGSWEGGGAQSALIVGLLADEFLVMYSTTVPTTDGPLELL